MTFYINSNALAECPLLNGCYEHCSDNTSITSADFIGIVGSLAALGTSGAATISQGAFTFGQVAVPGNPRNYLRLNWTTAATAGTPQFIHKIDDVRTFADRKVVLQGYYRTTAAMPVRLRQDFGTGGSPSADVNVAAQGLSGVLPTTVDAAGVAQWKPFTLSFNLPSVAGKTLGTTAATSYVAVDFLPSLNVLVTFDVTMLRLTPAGEQNPVYRRRTFSEESEYLAYYYRIYLETGTGAQVPISFVRRMRATPSMTASVGTASNPTTDSVHLNHTVNVAVSLTADARIAN